MKQQILIVCLSAALLFLPIAGLAGPPQETKSIERISPEAAKEKIDAGQAVLVCSYDDPHCGKMMIPGAITRDELARKKESLPRDTEIIFYCG